MDKLKQLESFVSVATKGSLTAAAKAEGVAPAIMGRRLDALEERLGVKLLVRTTRRLTLTHEGSAFLEDCQKTLNDLANAEAAHEQAVHAGLRQLRRRPRRRSAAPPACAVRRRAGQPAAMGWRTPRRGGDARNGGADAPSPPYSPAASPYAS